MQYLSLQEVAELEGKTWVAINKSVRRGSIKAEKVTTKGRCGFEYRVPITELSEKARIRYAAQHSTNFEVTPIPTATKEIDVKFDELSLDVRTEALRLEKIIKEWRLYLSEHPMGEVLHHLPGLESLNEPSNLSIPQVVIFAIGVMMFVLCTWLSYQKAAKDFEEIDL